MDKSKLWIFLLITASLLVVSIVSCTRQPSTGEPAPSPPTEPVTPGYVRVYDYKLSYGFEYPEDWEMQAPKVQFPLEKVEMFTKKGEGTSITIIVKSTNWTNLEEVKEQYGEIHPLKIVLKEDIIEVNGREGYEIIYKSPPMKTSEVVFLTNGRAFTISYSTTEDSYAASEEIFDHVICSFVIE